MWHEPLPEQVEEAARRKEFPASIAAIVKRAQDFSSDVETRERESSRQLR
jgi:hypothetical protein